jgi:hypothetical protein
LFKKSDKIKKLIVEKAESFEGTDIKTVIIELENNKEDVIEILEILNVL